jgi:hypothetical protein
MNDWHDTQTNHFVFGMQFDKNTFTQLHELCGGQYSWVVYHWNHPGGPGGTPFRCTGKGTGITQGNHGDDDGDLGKSAADSVGVKPMSWTGVKVLMK